MLDPITLSIISSSIPAVAQGITGFIQGKKGKDILGNLSRPTMEIPQAATQALNTARTLASSNQLPNQVQAQQGIDQSTANAMYNINQNATNSTEALAALTGVYGNQMNAQNELAGQAANFAMAQDQNFMNALNQYAGYQQQAWDYNVNQPYQAKLAEGQALTGAGMRNKYEALKTGAGIGANALMYKGLFGDKPTADTTVNDNMGADMGASNLTNEGKNLKLTPEQSSFVAGMTPNNDNKAFTSYMLPYLNPDLQANLGQQQKTQGQLAFPMMNQIGSIGQNSALNTIGILAKMGIIGQPFNTNSLGKSFGVSNQTQDTPENNLDYQNFKKTLPSNLKNTDESHYDMYYYWVNSNKPKDFNEAKKNEMFSMEGDGFYHAPSVEPNTLRFLKPKDHPTVQMELDWYNSNDPEAIKFRGKYDLDKSGKFYRYVLKKK